MTSTNINANLSDLVFVMKFAYYLYDEQWASIKS